MVAAVMLIKDEADIIEPALRWLHTQVDAVLVADNGSTDGTSDVLRRITAEHDTWTEPWLLARPDPVVGYYQAQKTTALAHEAFERGFDWVIPVDADEFWYSPFGRVGDVLDALTDEDAAYFASAGMLNHLTTGLDDLRDPDPFHRMRYRLVEENPLPKIACRTGADLEIGMGNHEAWRTGRIHSRQSAIIEGQLVIRHFPWRSPDQYLRKITNGAAAYAAAPELEDRYGAHWRSYGMPDEEGFEERVRAWFWEWGWREDPAAPHPGGPMMYDPAPYPWEDSGG